MSTGKRIPGGGLQFNPVVLKQREAERFRKLPVNIRACRMRQLVHLIAKGGVIRKRARIAAGIKVALRMCRHNRFCLRKKLDCGAYIEVLLLFQMAD